MRTGTFIVIDGNDGTGKKTQIDLLYDRLRKEGHSVKVFSFPNYGQPSATLIEAYLRGDFGSDPDAVNPYVTSTFYAVDRFAHSHEIKQTLEDGAIVLADRYVTANMAHQGAKILDARKRKEFMRWAYDFEYVKGELPQPDLNIILHVPTEVSLDLLKQRGNPQDIHENNKEYLKRSEKAYLEISENFKNTALVECHENEKIMSRESIHELIWKKINEVL